MKNLIVITFLFIGTHLKAQTIQSDLALLKRQQVSPSFPVNEKKTASFLSSLVFSDQWGHTCYFEIPCSDFSGQLVHRYGIVKGFFLMIDRYGKCNKLSHYETLPNRINTKGKIIDSVNFYHSW